MYSPAHATKAINSLWLDDSEKTRLRTMTKTTCPYCGVGCGVEVSGNTNDGWTVKGDVEHPSNFGRLCSKGSALGSTLGFEDRLLFPEVNGQQADWDQALDKVSADFSRIISEHGPDSVAFYLSGQLLTEDYYIANKLAKGFLGTANVDTNSRLCMSSSVAGHKRAFGADTVPNCYEDLEQADLLVLVGSNAAWCHPILFQRMQKNRTERGARLVNIDVRETATSKEADISLVIKPGTDVYLFNGLLVHLATGGYIDNEYINSNCKGYDEALTAALSSSPDIETVAEACGLKADQVIEFYDLFARTSKAMTCYSQGVNQSSSGTDKVNSILNCHLSTGRIGKVGSGPLSLTGQPNAMGGREVGGLANQLAAHMEFDPQSIDRVKRFWNAPNIATHPGLKAVDMFDALHEGKIKAIWIQCTNPAVSLPNSQKVREALSKAELVVVSECASRTDTMDFAHVKLPAATWGEKNGTVTNSERRISRQRSFLKAPGEARPDWWMVMEVARRMGFAESFDYQDAADIFKEHAKLSSFENEGTRDFDIGALKALSVDEYNNMSPTQWPVRDGSRTGQERLFASGGFFTPSGKGEILAVLPEGLKSEICDEFPLWLNTGRIRDQWHTMTRTARCTVLNRHRSEPFVEISAADTEKYGLKNGELARLNSKYGECILRVRVTDDVLPGRIFAPIHWTGVNSSSGVVSNLVAPITDKLSGQPESKATPVSVSPVEVAYSVLLISARHLPMGNPLYWTTYGVENCQIQLASFSEGPEEGWDQWSAELFGVNHEDLVCYEDAKAGVFRAAHFIDDALNAAVLISPGAITADRDIAEAWFGMESITDDTRNRLFSMRRLDGLPDRGPTVCACFAVGFNEITALIQSGEASTPEEIGKLLKAGTNCGSCIPELKSILVSETAK